MKLGRVGEATTAGVWLVLALLMGMGHFLVSEGAYQLGEHLNVEELHELSERISWPAGWIYERVEAGKIREVLMKADSGAEGEAARDWLREFDEKFHGDEEWKLGLWNWLDEQEMVVEVPVGLEYLIYGGVSLMWGLVLGLAGYGITRLVIAALPERDGALA